MATIQEKIEKVLKEKVDPVLAQHYGGSTLSWFDKGTACVKLTGACAQCPSAQDTIESVVTEILTKEVKDVKEVELDSSVSEDLLDMARKILNKEV